MLVAAYVRVSKEESAENDISIPAQKSRILAYCQALGWQIYDFYMDDGYSAKDLKRPEMKRLLEDCKKKQFSAVVVLRLDRISRKQKDVLYLIEDIFEPNGIGFKSVTQPFDTTSAFGKAAIGMLAVFAQLERDQLIERVTEAKAEAAEQGRYMGYSKQYGYDHVPGTKNIIVNESEAEVIRYIYKEYLRGDKGYQAIGDQLTEKGIMRLNGKPWERALVRKILTNPTYTGYVKHKGKLYEGKHSAIISREDFDKVQKLLGSRDKYRPSAGSGLVSNIIRCAECGAKMRTKNTWQNYPCDNPKHVIRYYVCYSQDGSSPHLVKKEGCDCGYKQSNDIDQKVVDKLMQYSLDTKLIWKKSKEELDGNKSKDDTRLINHLTKELDTVNKKINRWYEFVENGKMEPDELIDRLRDLRETKNSIETKLMEYQQAIETKADKQVTLQELVSALKHLPTVWEIASFEDKRAILMNMIDYVLVHKDGHVDVKFRGLDISM